MTKIKYFFTTAVLLLSFTIFGQYDSEHLFNNSNIVPSFNLRSNEFSGSSYINEQFLAVKPVNTNKTYLMRYNAYRDEIEFEKDGKLFYLTKTYNFLINFEGINKAYQVFSYQEKKNRKDGYFVILSKGKNVSLLLQEKIKYFDAVKARSGYNEDKPASLKRLKDKLYIGYKNNVASELPNKKNEILKLFSSKSVEVGAFAKKNNLGFKKKEDLTQIFKFYHSLK